MAAIPKIIELCITCAAARGAACHKMAVQSHPPQPEPVEFYHMGRT